MAMSVPLARAFPNEEHTASVSAGRKQAQRKAHERLSKQGVEKVNERVLRGEVFEGKGGGSSPNERRDSGHCSEKAGKGMYGETRLVGKSRRLSKAFFFF